MGDEHERETPISQEDTEEHPVLPTLGYDNLDAHWAELRAKGVPQAVIGMIARRKGAAPGQANYHGGKGK